MKENRKKGVTSNRITVALLAAVVVSLIGFIIIAYQPADRALLGKAYGPVALEEAAFSEGVVFRTLPSEPRIVSIRLAAPAESATAFIGGNAAGVTVSLGDALLYESGGSLSDSPEQIGDFSFELSRHCPSYPCDAEFTVYSASGGEVSLTGFSFTAQAAKNKSLSLSIEAEKNVYSVGDKVLLAEPAFPAIPEEKAAAGASGVEDTQVQQQPEAQPPAKNPSYKVQPVIFFSKDFPVDEEMIDYLKSKFEEIRQFYLANAGSTFTMLETVVVAGDNDHSWYWCAAGQEGCAADNFEHNIIAELKSKGFPVHEDWNQFPADRITWVAAFGGGGYAGGSSYPTGGGFALVGDAGLYAAKDSSCERILDFYYSPDEPNNIKQSCQDSWLPSGQAYGFGIGALGHELGHALGLPHPDGYSGTVRSDWDKTLLGNHWNYPDTGLLEQDKERLKQSPYFNVEVETGKCSELAKLIAKSLNSFCGDKKYDAVADVNKNQAVAQEDSDILKENADESWCDGRLNDAFDPCTEPRPVSLIKNPTPKSAPGLLLMRVQQKDSGEWADVEGGTVIDGKPISVPVFSFVNLSAEWDEAGGFLPSISGKYRVHALFMPEGSTEALEDYSEFSVRSSRDGKCTSNYDCPVYSSCDAGACISFCGGKSEEGSAGGEEAPATRSASRQELSRLNIARLKSLGFTLESVGGKKVEIDLSGYTISAEGSVLSISEKDSVIKFSGDVSSFTLLDSKGSTLLVSKAAQPPKKIASHIVQLRDESLLGFKSRTERETGIKGVVRQQLEAYRQHLASAKAQALVEMARANPGIAGSVVSEYSRAFNGFAVNLSGSDAAALRKVPSVRAVYPNTQVFATLANSVNQVSADEVWKLNDAAGQPLTGRGVSIAVIDTGVDYTHSDLGGCLGPGCKVVGGYDFVNNDADPMDDHGHGTHVAATAAGNGGLKGVAPDASIYAYKVLNSGGSGGTDAIISAIERAVDPNQDGDFSDHLNVISMSLGGPGTPDDPMSQAVDNAVNAGVVAVIAAGNSGPDEETVASPGTAARAITVGAVDSCDNIAYFSSRGPVMWQGQTLLKPDVVAPGVDICAAQWDSWLPENQCGQGRIAISGTSMATPHVSGVAALLLQAHPEWQPEDVKSSLMLTSQDLGLQNNVQGSGRVDALRAMDAPISVSPASLSFSLTEESSYSAPLTLSNLRDEEISVKFAASAFDENGNGVDYASVVPGELTLAPGEKAEVMLSVALPQETDGSFSGRVKISFSGSEFSVPFAFTRFSDLTVAAVDSAGNPLLADFYLHRNDLSEQWRASLGVDFDSGSYTFRLPRGDYTAYAVSTFESPVEFILSKKVTVPAASKVEAGLSLAEARLFTVKAESFGGMPLSLISWEKGIVVYSNEKVFGTTYSDPTAGDRLVYISSKPDNGLDTDIIMDYVGFPGSLESGAK